MSGDSNSGTVCRHCGQEIVRVRTWWQTNKGAMSCWNNATGHEPAPAEQPRHYDLPCPATKKVGDDVFYCTRRGHDDDNHTYSSPAEQPTPEERELLFQQFVPPVAASPAEGPRRVLPETLMDGVVTVMPVEGLRNEVGQFMWERGINMGDKLDAGRVQDLLEEWAKLRGSNISPENLEFLRSLRPAWERRKNRICEVCGIDTSDRHAEHDRAKHMQQSAPVAAAPAEGPRLIEPQEPERIKNRIRSMAWAFYQVLGCFYGINGPARIMNWFYDVAHGETREVSELFPITPEERTKYEWHEKLAAQPSAKVEEIAQELVNTIRARQIYAPHEEAEVREALAAILRPYFPEDAPDAVEMLRALNEETVLAGFPSGDRNQTLANVRAMKAQLKAAHEDIDDVIQGLQSGWPVAEAIALLRKSLTPDPKEPK